MRKFATKRSIGVGVMLALLPLIAFASVTSALINKQLETQQNLNLDTVLPDAMQQIGNQTGVHIEADPAVWELLPWGEQTTIKAKTQNMTLRQGLEAITQKLGLEFVLTDEAVQLRPMPALRRLGRRATVEELGVLDLMSRTPLGNDRSLNAAPAELLSLVDQQLAAKKSAFSIDNRAGASVGDKPLSIPRNITLSEALESLTRQTGATWYPWGRNLVVIPKEEQIRTQLDKRITARYSGVDVSQVLLELFQRAGIEKFDVDAGAYQRIPAQYRSIQLLLDDATVQQALESIRGYTGLGFEVTDKGIRVWNEFVPDAVPAAASAPTTRPVK